MMTHSTLRNWAWAGATALAWLSLLGNPYLYAQKDIPIDPLSWDRNIRGIVTKHCWACHGQDSPSGDVNLEQDVDIRQILDHRETWATALELVQSNEMPPAEADEPLKKEQRDLLIAFLEKTLNSLDCETYRDPGKPILRRLNRAEYDLAVEDLTGLKLDLAEGFAPDESSYGFDNIGDALSLSPVLVEQYHAAALTIVANLREQKTKDPKLFERALGSVPKAGEDGLVVARNAMTRFATAAFRRPVEADYLDGLLKIYQLARSRDEDHEQAMSHLAAAVLISPQFLMRPERNHPETDDPYPIDDYELASRLSFFLWSRPPDAELLELAAAGKLHHPEQLEKQTRRLLADPRSQALVDHFFGQWLSLRELEDHQPDQERFPEFTHSLRQAMDGEIRWLLSDLVKNDRSILELIDANFVYVNETLARHYGMPDVQGSTFRKVPILDRNRGGILTSAALLMLQSDPSRTNVPRRGNFIAGRILGTPPPPPPPNVPELVEAEADGKPRPLRELLEMHRQNPECAGCHAKMDPYGLTLENYDAIGRWRMTDGTFPIDAVSKLANGRELTGPASLKDYILENKNKFRRTLVKNLLIYAFGRGLQGSDECVIREVIAAANQDEDRFGTIVVSIVQSFPFTHRRNPLE